MGDLLLFLKDLCRPQEAQRRWEILSKLHERSWGELISKVTEFVEGRCGSGREEECWMPVVYGVYGSGKTTMLVELCEWSLKNSIPAARVYLSDVVNYIRSSRRRGISEADLPECVEEFFWHYLSSRLPRDLFESIKGKRGVLIIDEVEESFEELKSLVVGKSILRGLADKVRTGSINLLAVLGFAPSSVLAEAILQYAAAWRVKLIPLPSASTDVIYSRYARDLLVSNKLRSYERYVKELASNALWWLSKGGRPGWLDKLKREKVVESMFKTINYLAEANDFRELGLCYDFHQDPELSRAVRDTLKIMPVEGVPLFDYEEYLRTLEVVRAELRGVPADKAATMEALVKLLVCLVGPVSEKLLEVLLGRKIPPSLRPPSVVVRRGELVSMNILVDTYVEALKSNFDLEEDMLTRAREYLRSVLQPWSVDDLVIYDRDELKALLEEVLPLLVVEHVEEKLLEYIAKLETDAILRNAYERSKEVLPPGGENYYSLRVGVLRSLYKPITASPLVGCGKRVKLDSMISYLEKRVDLHGAGILTELKDRDIDVYALLGTGNLAGIRPEEAPERAILLGKNVIFLKFTSIPSLRGRAEELDKELRKRFGKLLDKLWVFELELPSILAQYLVSRIYSELNCPGELERLTGIDKVLDEQARRQLRGLASEVVERARGGLDRLRSMLRELSSEDLDHLKRNAHSIVGEEHARYMWLIGGSDGASELLKSLLPLIRSALMVELDGLSLGLGWDELVRGFKGALEKGDRYLESIRESAAKLRISAAEEHLEEVSELLRGLLELYIKNERVDVCRENPHEIVRDVRETIMRKSMGLPFNDVFITMILGEALQGYVKEEGCDIRSSSRLLDGVESELRSLIDAIKKLNSHLSTLREMVRDYVKDAKVPDLSGRLKDLETLREKLTELNKNMSNLPPYDRLLLDYYFEDELRKLPESIGRVRARIGEALSFVISIEEYLKRLKSVEEKLKDIRRAYEAVRSDLGWILSQIAPPLGVEGLRKVEEELKNYYKELEKYLSLHVDVVRRSGEAREKLGAVRDLLRWSG